MVLLVQTVKSNVLYSWFLRLCFSENMNWKKDSLTDRTQTIRLYGELLQGYHGNTQQGRLNFLGLKETKTIFQFNFFAYRCFLVFCKGK